MSSPLADSQAEYVRILADALRDDTMCWIAADNRPTPRKAAEIAVEAIQRAGYLIVPGFPQGAASVEPFEPDHDLVVKVAEYLSTMPRGQADMVAAYGILIHLYDLGIELPEHTDGPGSAD